MREQSTQSRVRRLAVLSGALAALIGCGEAATSLTSGDEGASPGEASSTSPTDPGSGSGSGSADPGSSSGDSTGDPLSEAGSDGSLSGDAGAADAKADVVRTPSCAGTFLCDDFESAVNGKPSATWTLEPSSNPGGLIAVDTTKPFSGTKSVHIKSGGGVTGGDAVRMRTTMGLPHAGNHVFGRMMMWLKGPWPTTHIRVMGMQNNAPTQGYLLDAFAGNRGFQLESLVDNFGGGGTRPLVTDQWKCIEWELNAPTNGAVTTHVWIDSTEILPATSGFPYVSMNSLWVGYTTALKSTPIEMWLDDVALSTTRIGCPAQ